MGKYRNIIIYIVLFAMILVLATISYNFLKEEYEPQDNQNKVEISEEKNKASDFYVLNSDIEQVKLSDFFGKPIVVNFWTTWCAPCKGELPYFENAYKKYGENVEFLMVNLTDGRSETITRVQDFMKENGYEFPVYFDTEFSASYVYEIYSIPQTLFIDKNGNIVNSYIGAISENTLEKNIEKIIGE